MPDITKEMKDKNPNDGRGPDSKDDHKPEPKQPPAPLESIELFVQGENVSDIELIKLPGDARVSDIVEAMKAKGLAHDAGGESVAVMLEDEEAELPLSARLRDLGIGQRRRFHCHRCRRVKVSVTFNGVEKTHPFATSATIARVKAWADEKFGLEGVDATEQELQVSGTSTRPAEDTHIGTLVRHPACTLNFTLAPKERVQG